MKLLSEIFNDVLTGDKQTSKMAKDSIRKAYMSAALDRSENFEDVLIKARFDYKNVLEDWRKEYLVSSVLRLCFIVSLKNRLSFFYEWFYELLDSDNGNIRKLVVREMETDFYRLTFHIRHPKSYEKELLCFLGKVKNEFLNSDNFISAKQAEEVLFEMYCRLLFLANFYGKENVFKYKYIDEIPVSKFKSVAYLLSYFDQYCGNELLKKFEKKLKNLK